MAINFPASPTDGQTYTENGVKWKYNSAYTAWLVVDTPILANTSSGQVLYNYNDTIVSSNGISFSTEANTLYVNGMNVSSTLIVDGNVGIGTSSPATKLQISGTTDTIQFQTDYAGTTGVPAGALIRTAGNSSLTFIADASSGTAGKGVTISAYSGGAWFRGLDYSNRSGTPNLVLQQDGGNVGIGTTSPGTIMDIIGPSGAARGMLLRIASDNGAYLQLVKPGFHEWYVGTPTDTNALVFGNNRNIVADGTERMRITSSGNVGIGTSSPDALFNTLKITAGDSTDAIWKHTYDVNWGIRLNQQHVSGSHIQWNWVDTAGNNLMSWKFGNVGIGTTTPDGKFTVNAGSITSFDVSNPSGYTLQLSHYITTTGASSVRKVLSGIQGLVGSSDISNYQGSLAFLTTPSAGSPTERMRITSAGYVGIGTSTPKNVLHVSGSAILQQSYQTYLVNSYYDGAWKYVENGMAWGIGNNFGGPTNGMCIATAPVNASGNDAALTWTPRINISSTGLVGIGTSSPTSTFTVEGGVTEIRSGGYLMLRPTANDWDFRLQSLSGNKLGIFSGGDLVNPVATFVNGGNVGINRSSPSYKLDVNGSLRSDYILFGSNQSVPTADAAIIRPADGTLALVTSSAEQMRITSAGSVGIGTTSPSYKLHVEGTIYGNSSAGVGVRGNSSSSIGVYGISSTNIGTRGDSASNYGVYGSSTNSHGVVGRTDLSGGIGVYAFNSVNNTQLYGAYSSYAAYGTGNAYFSGSLSKGSGSFKIPHPLPELSETHNLVHSFVEAPTADNIYRGKVQLENGQATVNIDTHVGMTEGTFSALNGNIQVFLQNDSGWDLVRGSVSDNILTIISQNQSSTDTISWMVIGERQDQHMLDTQWTDEFGRPILEPLKEPEPDIPLPEVSNENG